jgi:hypothetical protein
MGRGKMGGKWKWNGHSGPWNELGTRFAGGIRQALAFGFQVS